MKTHWSRNFITVLATLAMVFSTFGQFAAPASANPTLDAATFLDCDAQNATQPTGDDLSAANALEAAGFDCTRLLNKGQLNQNNVHQVGQLWFRTSGTTIQLRYLIYGASNTGATGSKVCLDDDINPINSILGNLSTAASCVGNEVANTVAQGADGGPNYPPAKSAGTNPEEAAGKFELAVEPLVEISETWGGTTVGGWNVNLGPNTGDLYSEILPHFDHSGFSIVAYFQRPEGCPDWDLTLTVDGAGRSDLSYDSLVSGAWIVTFYYTTDDPEDEAADWVALDGELTNKAPFYENGEPTQKGQLIFEATDDVAVGSVVSWYYTFTEVGSGDTVFDSRGDEGDLFLETTSDAEECTVEGTVRSEKTALTIYKIEDITGAGFPMPDSPDGFLELIFENTGLEGWTIIASSEFGDVQGITEEDGSVIIDLDEFLTWTICEVPQDGYIQTFPSPDTADGCYTLAAGSGDDVLIVFANFKTVDLTVEKTADTTFDRAFDWTVAKDVDKTSVTQVGGNAIFNYTITVTKGAAQDGGFTVSGTITVTNPNPIAVDVDLSDEGCTLEDESLTVPAASWVEGDEGLVWAYGTASTTYECEVETGDSGTNTATAEWDNTAELADTTGSAEGTADYEFGDPANIEDDCADLSDSVEGDLGEFCDSGTAEYERTIAVVSGCNEYDNTATLTEQDSESERTDSVTVTVCGPITGGFTIGFWQNKNGQAKITGDTNTGGVCDSTTYLRSFAPFEDLAANATCTQVATYVTNTIKSANAKGSSMNAMLKAQMLATALSVYFSTEGLGNQAIDLTAICTNSACTSTVDASPAFGGASSLTVSAMLTHAASQSNSGGSIWYAQVKATQALAKDAFDAINNNVVFAP